MLMRPANEEWTVVVALSPVWFRPFLPSYADRAGSPTGSAADRRRGCAPPGTRGHERAAPAGRCAAARDCDRPCREHGI